MGVSRKTSLVHSIVNILVAPSTERAYEEKGHQDTEEHENRQRKKSLLQNFVDILFYDEEDKYGDNSSQTKIKNTTGDPQNVDTKEQVVLELQNLDRERKKSLLVHVIDRLLSRSDHSQQELSTEGIENSVMIDSENGEHTAAGNTWGKEVLQDLEKETYNSDINKKLDTVKVEDEKRELEMAQEDKTASLSAKCRKRRSGVVSTTNDGKLGLPNLGFEYERSEEIEKDCSSDTSGLREQKKSVTFSPSAEFPGPSLMTEDRGREFKVDESVEKASTVAENGQGRNDKEIDSVESGNNSSVSEVFDLPVSSPIHPSKKKRPKLMKDWLRDPNLYKVCQFLYHFYNHISDKINSLILCDR